MKFRGQHIIKLSHLAENFEALKKIAPQSEICFMVKGNAYGHGVLPIVEFSYNEAKITEFGLASLNEALFIRQAFPHMRCEQYVFSDLQLQNSIATEAYLNRRILPVISNKVDFDYFLGNQDFKNFPLILKFDTGMHRLGLDISDKSLDNIIKNIKKNGRKSVYHLMTHFACSSLCMKKNSKNIAQYENFIKLKKYFSDAGITIERSSISNSGAIEQGVGLDETHIRPGLMLYGPSSLIDKYEHLSSWNQPIISQFTSYVLQTRSILKGTPVGYGATVISRSGFLAIISVGYGDGLSSHYQNSFVGCEGHSGQIVGRINMDMAQVLFDDNAKDDIKEGSEVVIFDHNAHGLKKLCKDSKMIPYEVFLNITARISKSYI